MTLRARLFITSAAVVVPLAVGLSFINERLRLREMDQTLRRFVEPQLSAGGLDRCRAEPARFGSPGRGGPGRRGGPPPPSSLDAGGRPRPGDGPYDLFAYSADFIPADPEAPAMPGVLREALAALDEAVTTYSTTEGPGLALAVRADSADSPCAIVLARMRPRPGVLRDERASLGLVVVSVLVAAWIAAGPVIARMRRLADSVRRSAESQYEVPVESLGTARDELGDLARAFNAAGASVRQHVLQVEARREALGRFVGNTTHDVALPLTVLQGHLVELDRALPPGSPERARVAASIQEAHYMASLLRNLGAAATLDDTVTALDRRPVDVSALVERVVARHQPVARARAVSLDHAVPETPVRALADVTLLEQAVGNLVDNAVKYNRAGGHVAIVLDRRAHSFVLTVRDDGPGVSDDELAVLTTRRFRGTEARTRRPDGQGLGLAIAAEAIECLDFRLAFHRSNEGGLTAEISGATDGRE